MTGEVDRDSSPAIGPQGAGGKSAPEKNSYRVRLPDRKGERTFIDDSVCRNDRLYDGGGIR